MCALSSLFRAAFPGVPIQVKGLNKGVNSFGLYLSWHSFFRNFRDEGFMGVLTMCGLMSCGTLM